MCDVRCMCDVRSLHRYIATSHHHITTSPHRHMQRRSPMVGYEVVDRVAVLTIDNPPVNALSPAVWEAIDAAVARAGKDESVDAAVLIGAGTTFIAGADIKVFDTLKTREDSLKR